MPPVWRAPYRCPPRATRPAAASSVGTPHRCQHDATGALEHAGESGRPKKAHDGPGKQAAQPLDLAVSFTCQGWFRSSRCDDEQSCSLGAAAEGCGRTRSWLEGGSDCVKYYFVRTYSVRPLLSAACARYTASSIQTTMGAGSVRVHLWGCVGACPRQWQCSAAQVVAPALDMLRKARPLRMGVAPFYPTKDAMCVERGVWVHRAAIHALPGHRPSVKRCGWRSHEAGGRRRRRRARGAVGRRSRVLLRPSGTHGD